LGILIAPLIWFVIAGICPQAAPKILYEHLYGVRSQHLTTRVFWVCLVYLDNIYSFGMEESRRWLLELSPAGRDWKCRLR